MNLYSFLDFTLIVKLHKNRLAPGWYTESMNKKSQATRKLLQQLERTGKFVFHGSPTLLTELKPQQQKNYSAKKKALVHDGRPAICATPFADVATFRSLVRQGWTSFGTKNGQVMYGASALALNRAKTATGWVYILTKQKFHKRTSFEMRAYKTLLPLAIIPVTFKDFSHRRRAIKNRKEYRRHIGLK